MNVSQAISCFLSGLQPDIQNTVRVFKPSSIHDAYCLAKLQEATLSTLQKRSRPVLEKTPYRIRTTQNTFNNPKHNAYIPRTYPQTQNPQNFPRNPRTHRLNLQEIDEKRAKKLCFFCDEKYVSGHKCKGQVYRMEFIVVDEENFESPATETESREEEEEIINNISYENMPQISLNALSGVNSYHTMRVTGKIKNSPIHILIDSGSTYNFLDLATAKKLGCYIKKTCPMEVVVANGDNLLSNNMCKNFL